MTAMSICVHSILLTGEKVPDSLIIAYDDNFKLIDDVSDLHRFFYFIKLIEISKILPQIPFPAVTIVPEFTHPIEWLIFENNHLKYRNPNYINLIKSNEELESFKR